MSTNNTYEVNESSEPFHRTYRVQRPITPSNCKISVSLLQLKLQQHGAFGAFNNSEVKKRVAEESIGWSDLTVHIFLLFSPIKDCIQVARPIGQDYEAPVRHTART